MAEEDEDDSVERSLMDEDEDVAPDDDDDDDGGAECDGIVVCIPIGMRNSGGGGGSWNENGAAGADTGVVDPLSSLPAFP